MGFSFKQNTLSMARLAILANNLARLNDNRGGDSWGVCSVNDKEVNVSRGLGQLANHAHEVADHRNFFAHTRYATHGKKTVENAHPFEIGDIVGAHNGVISNHQELCRKYEREFDVDSMHLFAHLAERKSFEEIEGYGAIEWIRRDDPTRINLCRISSSGDLAIFGIGDRSSEDTIGIVWSSNDKHLLESLYCSGIKTFFPYRVNEGVVYYVRDGEVYLATDGKLELKGKTYSYSGSANNYNRSTTITTDNSGNDTLNEDEARYEAWKRKRFGSETTPIATSSTTTTEDKGEKTDATDPFQNMYSDGEENEIDPGAGEYAG
jgi:Glutamine amidotransferase domain